MSITDDYVTFILSFSGIAPISVLSLFFLGLIRLAPVVALAPFLGSKLPSPVKMGLLIALTAIVLPTIITTSARPAVQFDTTFLLYTLKEFFIGLIIAIFTSIPFYIAQSSGVLIDFLRGSSSLMVTDPFMQTQASPIGLLYNYVFIVLFYQIEGPFIFLSGILNSYNIIPADAFLAPSFFVATKPLWTTTTQLLTKFTALSIQLAAPSIVAVLMAEVFLGIANRLAPQVQIAFLGMALKSLLGIALLWAAWFFILQQIAKQSLIWLNDFSLIFQSFPKG